MKVEVMHLKCMLEEIRGGRFQLVKYLGDDGAVLISVDDVSGPMTWDESCDALAAISGIPVSPVLVRRLFDPPENDSFIVSYGTVQLVACLKFASGERLNFSGSGDRQPDMPNLLEAYGGKTINDLSQRMKDRFDDCLVVVLPDRVRLDAPCA